MKIVGACVENLRSPGGERFRGYNTDRKKTNDYPEIAYELSPGPAG
jgi:hypothetical protein